MKFTIQCEPDVMTAVAQSIRRYMGDGRMSENRHTHRDCVVYVPQGNIQGRPYEVHVWGDEKHVRAYRFELQDEIAADIARKQGAL